MLSEYIEQIDGKRVAFIDNRLDIRMLIAQMQSKAEQLEKEKKRESEYKIFREALQYGVMWSRNESETAEFALLLLKVEKILMKMKK